MIRKLTSIAVALCAVVFVREAKAQYAPPPPGPAPAPSGGGEEIGRPGISAGAVLGFGAHSGYGFGLGVEGGYSLPMHLYLGANFTYYTGSDDVSAWLFEPQIGYDLDVIHSVPILIRPYVGIGYENVSLNLPGCGSFGISCSGGGFLISPGVVGSYFITPHIYAGADIRLDIGTGTGSSAVIAFFANGGYKF